MSMIPGVTNLPVPSITTGDSPPSACLIAGSSVLLPTAAILLSFMRSAPFTMRGPTAANMVTFSMSVGWEGGGVSGLVYGAALGTERAPGPAVAGGVVAVRAAVVSARAGTGACVAGACFAHPATVIASARASIRMLRVTSVLMGGSAVSGAEAMGRRTRSPGSTRGQQPLRVRLEGRSLHALGERQRQKLIHVLAHALDAGTRPIRSPE